MAAHEEYCSRACAVAVEGETSQRFLDGLDHPFDSGLRLWRSSLRPLVAAVAPVAAAIAIVIWLLDAESSGSAIDSPTGVTDMMALGLIGLGLYGVVLTGTVLSQQYTSLISGRSHLWALKRLGPWMLTWAMVLAFITAGYFLLVIPGIVAALRLFWADEFAVAHRLGPWRSVRESWTLTKGETGAILGFQLFAGLFAWLVLAAGFSAVFVVSLVAPDTVGADTSLQTFALSLAFFVGYGVIHAVEITKFYGMRAAARVRDWQLLDAEHAPPIPSDDHWDPTEHGEPPAEAALGTLDQPDARDEMREVTWTLGKIGMGLVAVYCLIALLGLITGGSWGGGG